MPGKCPQCGSRTYLARTTIQTDLIDIENIPCTVCQECGQEQIGQQVQKKIDKLLERAAKGKLKVSVVDVGARLSSKRLLNPN
jgi:peptide subunit release factor 1 (eRF1)